MNRLKEHLRSYRYSIRGVWLAFRYERVMLFHLVAAIAVIAVNCLLKISRTDWLITLILIGLAWTAEIFNTAIEKLADRVTKEQDLLIGQVKDLASGAVLVICFFAVACAVIIYWPYLR
ncbi:MAG: diacylglycerol kinase family protein [Bacteroidota bacterium]